MKKQTRFLILGMLALWFGLSTGMRNPSNPPLGSTGAPGENTCQRSGCHGGGSFTGSVQLTGLPDTVVPGQSYTLTLTHTSNAVRTGFQLTCLDSLNTKAGSLVAGTASNVASTAGRQYIRHTNFKTLSGGSASWSFSWTAPATAGGDEATFYFTSIAANAAGGASGDNVLTNTRKIVLASPSTSTDDPALARLVRLYPSPFTDVLTVNLSELPSAEFQLFDAQGKQVLRSTLTDSATEIDAANLPKGVYYAFITAGNRSTRKAVVKQ